MYFLFKIIPELVFSLEGTFFKKSAQTVQLWVYIILRKFYKHKRLQQFSFYYNGTKIKMYLRSAADIAALKELYVDLEYAWDDIRNPKVIVDLGAHNGDTALYYHAIYPDAQIIAVEPSPENFALLIKNTVNIKNIHPLNAAVCDYDGTITLHITTSSLGVSLKERKTGIASVQVPAYSLETILKMFGHSKVDLVKFDIEGAEDLLFKNVNDPMLLSSAYIGEVHADLISLSEEDFMSQFTNFTVEKVELSNSNRFIIKAKSLQI